MSTDKTGFNGWSFGSTEMHSKVRYIAVLRGDLDLTNAYGLDSDEALSEFLRDESEYSRLYAVFEVKRVVTPNVYQSRADMSTDKTDAIDNDGEPHEAAPSIEIELERLRIALDPFACLFRVVEPLGFPDDTPLRDVAPGLWPTLGDCRAANAAFQAEKEPGWKVDEWRPNYKRACAVCGQRPVVDAVIHAQDGRPELIVYRGTMCGVCAWGESAMRDPARWNR